MKKGDILLIHYKYDPVAWIIRKLTKSHWNHVAWAIDNRCIIESKRNGISVTVDKYKNKFLYETKLLEIKMDENDLELAVTCALLKMKKRSYFKHILSCLLVMIGYEGEIEHPTCSGLIAESLAQLGFYFNKKKRPSLITPEDIKNSKKTINKERI